MGGSHNSSNTCKCSVNLSLRLRYDVLIDEFFLSESLECMVGVCTCISQ